MGKLERVRKGQKSYGSVNNSMMNKAQIEAFLSRHIDEPQIRLVSLFAEEFYLDVYEANRILTAYWTDPTKEYYW